MSAPHTEDKHQEFLHRQKLKGKASQCLIWGFVCLSHRQLGMDFQGSWAWGGLVVGCILVTLGVRQALPLWQAERQENAERKKQEQAELEAANLFLFGTPKMPR
jgi:hypothetical protein